MKDKFSIDKLDVAFEYNEHLAEELRKMNEGEVAYLDNGCLALTSIRPVDRYNYTFSLTCYDGDRGWFNYGLLYFDSTIHSTFCTDMYIHVNNDVLYDESRLHFLFGIQEDLGLQFKHIRKLEIAYDCEYNIIHRFMHYYRDYENYDIVILNEVKDSEDEHVDELLHIKTGSRKNPYKVHTIYILKKDGNYTPLKLRAYNKRVENKEQIEPDGETSTGVKQYQCHPDWKAVYRLEIGMYDHQNIQKSIDRIVKKRMKDEKVLDKMVTDVTCSNETRREREFRKCREFLSNLNMSDDEVERHFINSEALAHTTRSNEYMERLMVSLHDEDVLKELFSASLHRLVHFRQGKTQLPLIPLLQKPISRKKRKSETVG